MTGSKIILLACGSFNPPTNMHLRMFEIARDHLNRYGAQVIGGIISPVHDGYAKADLVSVSHRLKMLELALETCDWIKVSDWESRQESWQRTRSTLQYHQNHLNSLLNSKNMNGNEDWFVDNDNLNRPVQVKLLCGGDLLESFATPGLWSNEDIEAIVGRHGLVVITRENTNPQKFIYNSDVLTKYMANITIVTEWIKNEVSSTKIRRALKRDESVKYLIPDNIIEYIRNQSLYGCKINNEYLQLPNSRHKQHTPNNNRSPYSSTPSPIDMSTDTPSPTSLSNRLPCMNMCNNNMLNNEHQQQRRLSFDVPDSAVLQANRLNAAESAAGKGGVKHHPGQAVKVVASAGGKTMTTTATVRSAGEVKLLGVVDKAVADKVTAKPIKSSKSCVEFHKIGDGQEISQSKSNDSLDCKSCDENLIKFIFTKHGIQVISDVETIV